MSHQPGRPDQDAIARAVHEQLSQIQGFSPTTGEHQDLQLAGVTSLDLLVVLSQLEREFDVTLDDVFVAKGHTIRTIARSIFARLTIGAH
jgi:acyl carrier protein